MVGPQGARVLRGGLRWGDVDFEHGRLSVQRAVTKGDDGPVLAEPKMAKSRRTVPLLAGLGDALLAHPAWQAERGLDASGHVFTNEDGGMLTPWTFNKKDLKRVAKAAGMGQPDEMTLYTLRPTFGTLNVRAGTPLKVVSELMGHATIQMTGNTYQHVSTDVTEDWMRRYEVSLIPKAERPAAAAN